MASDAEIQALREMLNTKFNELHLILERIARALEIQAQRT